MVTLICSLSFVCYKAIRLKTIMNNTYFIAMLKSILFNQVLKASEIAFGGCVLCEQPKIKFECENTIQYIGCLFVCKTANISQISCSMHVCSIRVGHLRRYCRKQEDCRRPIHGKLMNDLSLSFIFMPFASYL